MNKIILMGRLTKDPEIRYSQNNTAIAKYSLAVDRRFKRDGDPEADFFTCSAFGKSAEFVEKYLKKGTKIVVVGEIHNNNYTNKNGEKVYSFEVLVSEHYFAESKKSEENEVVEGEFQPVPPSLAEELPFN
jgi:single-strand DNA-binding protein